MNCKPGDLAGLHIDWIGGNCPVQAEGTIDGVPFYFRARGFGWSFGVGEDPVCVSMGIQDGWSKAEEWGEDEFSAGWMPIEEAQRIIERCAEEYSAGKPKAKERA